MPALWRTGGEDFVKRQCRRQAAGPWQQAQALKELSSPPFPWPKRPRFFTPARASISVEHNHGDQRQPLFDLLRSQGYRRKFEKLSHVDDWYVLGY